MHSNAALLILAKMRTLAISLREKCEPYQTFVVLFIAIVLLLGRGYHRFVYPQFWAEDGRNWFADAHNSGMVATIAIPYSGYLHVLPRLIASTVSWLRPDVAAIMIFLWWIFMQAGMAIMIWRRRSVIGGGLTILVLTSMILAPYAQEVYGNLTNLMWYGAVLMAVLCSIATKVRLNVSEYVMAAILGLSGPHSILIGAIMVFGALIKRKRYDPLFCVIIAVCSTIVVGLVMFSGRNATEINYPMSLVPAIVGKHVMLGGVAGLDAVTGVGAKVPLVGFWILGMAVFCLLGWGIVRGNVLEHELAALAILIVVASIVSPVVADHGVSFTDMMTPGVGSRYWFVPILAMKCQLMMLALHAKSRLASGLIWFCVAYGFVMDYRIGAYPNEDFMSDVVEFEEAPRGSVVDMSIYPPGWSMTIVK